MLVLAFYALFFLATSQISTSSPINGIFVNYNKLQREEHSSFELSRTNVERTPITVARTNPLNRRAGPEQDTPETTYLTPTTTTPTTTNENLLSNTIPSHTSPSPPIPTKSLPNCNVQGIATPSLLFNILERLYAHDAYACQLQCMYVSRCEAYSWQLPASTESHNCVFYATLIDGTEKVLSRSGSGIFFSDKYPGDGSNFCYGSASL